jgi:GEVED domain
MKKFLFFAFSGMMLVSAAGIAQSSGNPLDCIHTNSFTQVTYISHVQLGSINNTSLRSEGGFGHYTNLSTNLAIGSSYTITVRSSGTGSYQAHWAAYIDYNKNGVTSDAGELIGSGTVPSGSSTSFTFAPPPTAFNGPTTLLVHMTQSRETHCVSYLDEGENEDYTVNITGGYCYAHGLNTQYEYINKIIFGHINNLSGNNNGYGGYTSQSTNLTAGFSYTLSLYPGYNDALRHEYVRVYIDYNKDKVFSNTSPFVSELIATMDGTGFMSKKIQIPFTAPSGTTRLRILMTPSGSVTDPCSVLSWGEVEDYTVNILPPVLTTGLQAGEPAMQESKAATIMVAPNPVKAADAKIFYTVINAETVIIKITDLSGHTLQTLSVGNKAAGSYSLPLGAVHALTAGTYFITMEQNNRLLAQSRFVLTE